MKKTIIPAGTPGIFRPGFGQYPEPESNVLTWQARHADNAPYSLHRLGASVHNNPAVYAWQYAPTPPPVDDFEAWCEGWRMMGFCMGKIHDGVDYIFTETKQKLIVWHLLDRIFESPAKTLIEAQRAAYQHFLESLKD